MSEPILQDILPIDIVFNAGTQARVQTDKKTVQAYTESMEEGTEFPPIDVFHDAATNQYILADGFHRYTAHRTLHPNQPIHCLVHEGDAADARIFACGANATHGLRRTNEDKRKAIRMILQEPKCQEWSDRKIAEYVLVSHTNVQGIRKEMIATGKVCQSTQRIGQDGRVYETKNIGKTYDFDEEPEPDTKYRTNADGKTVNIKGFDFKAHRRCEQCEKWDDKTGYCLRDDHRQPSWSPACGDFLRRETGVEPYKPPLVSMLNTKPPHVPQRKHKPHAHHVREKRLKCDLFPNNPQLTAIEIRDALGEAFLMQLVQAIAETNDLKITIQHLD